MNLLQEYIIVVLVLIFIKNWLNEYYNIIIWNVSPFSKDKEWYELFLILA